MKILITGSGGSIGSELFRQLAEAGNSVLAFDNNETAVFDLYEEYKQKGFDVHYRLGDVRDESVVEETFRTFQPEVVFHAAALKHVTPSEAYPRETVRTNVLGTLNVIGFAKKYGVQRLVYVSTDKVLNYNGVMGITKRLGEVITRNAGYVAVRFGNVMRSRGSVLEIWERQLFKNEPLTITDERMERFMMSIPQACQLLIKASQIGNAGEVLVMDMGEPIKIVDLAKEFLMKHNKPDHPIKVIGIRPGEELSERLMSEDEQKIAVRDGDFIIIK